MVFRLLVILTALSVQSATAGEPSFTTGDVSALECRVLESRACGDTFSLLIIDVVNSGTVAAEPLEFRIELADKKSGSPRTETYQRTTLPRFCRYGRPAPPGGKQKYHLPTGLIGKKAQYAVSVTRASFVLNGDVAKPDILAGNPKQVERTSLAGTFPITAIELKNPFDTDLDALFLVTLTQPLNSVELMGARIPAGGSRILEIASRPGPKTFVDGDPLPGCAMKATRFELVDWSLVAKADANTARQILQPAYDAWLRWPDAPLAITANFKYRERRQRPGDPNQYDFDESSGKFQLNGSGGVDVITLADPKKPEPKFSASYAIRAVIAELWRVDFEKAAKDNELVAIADDRVEVRGPGFAIRSEPSKSLPSGGGDAAGASPDYQVHDGRIVSDGIGDGQRTTWETRGFMGGYVVSRRRSASTDTVCAYQEWAGLAVPVHITQTVAFGGKLSSSFELEITDYRKDAAEFPAAAPPQGDGAAALRAIWEATYRFPKEPIKLSASFEVTNPGTDMLWHGKKKLTGKLTMEGIGRNARSLHLDFDGKLAPEVEMSLAGAFSDRLLMWYSRDFDDRSDFDVAFARATIHAMTEGGSFAIDGALAIAKVLTRGDVVTGFVHRDGRKTEFTYTKVDGRLVVSKVEATNGMGAAAWTESVTISLVKVGDHLLPSSLRFEKIFAKDWGPETITFKDWR